MTVWLATNRPESYKMALPFVSTLTHITVCPESWEDRSDGEKHLDATLRILLSRLFLGEQTTYSPSFLNGSCRMLLIIVFRTKPSLGKMSHSYYCGNRCSIKMSYLSVALLFCKHIPEIHQEKGLIEVVLYFSISIFKILFTNKYSFRKTVLFRCISN